MARAESNHRHKEFLYRYRASGQDKTVSLGRYDGAERKGLTLAGGTRERAHEIRALQRSTSDVKEHLRAEERQREIVSRRGSLRELLAAYVKALRDAGKPSADQVEEIFRRNILKPFRVLADAKASEIEPGDIQRILARLVKQGIKRQVNVTRSYPTDTPYPSRLWIGHAHDKPLHVVAADNPQENERNVITVYEPDPAPWGPDLTTRKQP